jgi:hypothetical protein
MTCGVQITGQMMRICCLCYWILFLVSGITVVGAKPTSAQSNTHRHHAANNKAFKGLLFLPHLFDSFPSFFPCVWLCHRVFYYTSIFFRNRVKQQVNCSFPCHYVWLQMWYPGWGYICTHLNVTYSMVTVATEIARLYETRSYSWRLSI